MKTNHLVQICLIGCLFITACSKPLGKAHVGRWEEQGKPGFIEFFPDNTFLLYNGSQQFSGKWIVVGKDRIKADFTVLDTTRTMLFEDTHVSGKRMTATVQGKKRELKRIKKKA